MALVIIFSVLGLAACSSASQSGWVLQYLQSNKMELRDEKAFLDSESQPFKKCAPEWNQHGTFCFPDLVTSYQTQDRDLMNRLVSELTKIVTTIAQLVDTIVSKMESLSKKNSVPGINVFGFVNQQLNKGAVKDLNAGLKKFLNRYRSPNKNGRADSCWDKMASMREQTICFACSGRHLQFEADSKLSISPTTCSAVVRFCKVDFSLLATISHGSKELISGLRNLLIQTGTMQSVLKTEIDSAIRSLGSVEGPTLLRLLQESSKAGPPAVVAKARAEFCQKSLSLVESSFLEFIMPIYRQTESVLRAILKTAENITSRSNFPRSPTQALSVANKARQGLNIPAPVLPAAPIPKPQPPKIPDFPRLGFRRLVQKSSLKPTAIRGRNLQSSGSLPSPNGFSGDVSVMPFVTGASISIMNVVANRVEGVHKPVPLTWR